MKANGDVTIVTHVPHEGPGAIGDYLLARGRRVVGCPVYLGSTVPAPGETDMVVLMGGPMSVNDRDRIPWLEPELAAIARHLDAGTPMLGVCLGAQLLCASLGAEVSRSQPEVGWWPVEVLQPRDQTDPWFPVFSDQPARTTVFHWHGETAQLPQSAVLRATSPACPNQAFTVGHSIAGLQFHLEMRAPDIGRLAEAASADVGRGTYSRTPDGVDPGSFFLRCAGENNGWGRTLLHAILAHLESAAWS